MTMMMMKVKCYRPTQTQAFATHPTHAMLMGPMAQASSHMMYSSGRSKQDVRSSVGHWPGAHGEQVNSSARYS